MPRVAFLTGRNSPSAIVSALVKMMAPEAGRDEDGLVDLLSEVGRS